MLSKSVLRIRIGIRQKIFRIIHAVAYPHAAFFVRICCCRFDNFIYVLSFQVRFNFHRKKWKNQRQERLNQFESNKKSLSYCHAAYRQQNISLNWFEIIQCYSCNCRHRIKKILYYNYYKLLKFRKKVQGVWILHFHIRNLLVHSVIQWRHLKSTAWYKHIVFRQP
jgi:hypothetical protein